MKRDARELVIVAKRTPLFLCGSQVAKRERFEYGLGLIRVTELVGGIEAGQWKKLERLARGDWARVTPKMAP